MSSESDVKCSKIHLDSKSALVLTKTDFRRATQNLYGEPEKKYNSLKDADYEEYLKNGSREMVKTWDNTLEKIRQRKVAALKKKEEQKKAEGLTLKNGPQKPMM